MANTVICLYHKYGFCKYKETCRHRHIDVVCDKHDCEHQTCSNRHPRRCRYFQQFGRCKFGTYCAFLHVPLHDDHIDLENEMKSMEAQISSLEKLVSDRDSRLEALENKMKSIEEENQKLGFEMKQMTSNILKITEAVVDKSVEKVVETFDAIQTEKETRMNLKFNVLTDQVAAVVSFLKTSQIPQKSNSPHSKT